MTEMVQIPLIEHQLLIEGHGTTDITGRVQIARQLYAARGRDISTFARILVHIYGVDTPVGGRLGAYLEAFRARQLLFKDLADIERDL